MKRLLIPEALALAVLAAGLGAQSPPDFSGKWTMDPARSDAAQQAVPSGAVTVAIRQSPGEIRIETTENGNTKAVTYLPYETTVLAADSSAGTFRWDGSRLITDLVVYISQQAVTLREIRTLDAARDEMAVEMSLVVEHGYRGGDFSRRSEQRPSNASKGKNVFVRAR